MGQHPGPKHPGPKHPGMPMSSHAGNAPVHQMKGNTPLNPNSIEPTSNRSQTVLRFHDARHALLPIAAFLAITLLLCMCSCSAGKSSGSAAASQQATASESSALPTRDTAASSASASENAAPPEEPPSQPPAEEPVSYPTGWLVASAADMPAGQAVRIRTLPDMPVEAHRNGTAIPAEEQAGLQASLPEAGPDDAIVEFEGRVAAVNKDFLLVNLPDILPQAVYDIVYSYASTSRCAGQDIPGVTGQRLEGYAEGKQGDAYLASEQFAVPCAYRTALKAAAIEGALEQAGYRLLVYDAYRPMTAQFHLSNAFQQAYDANEAIRSGIEPWSVNWFVALGASGHNFGTDLDVGACTQDGTPCPMPSAFDAFDASGHLTDIPMDAASITPDAYCQAVAANDACMALHREFTAAGFTEIASEWWHFGDEETEFALRGIVGDGGLDFVAVL